MDRSNANKSAFGVTIKDNGNAYHSEAMGLTKREYFAGLAMQGLLASDLKTIPNVPIDQNTKAMCCASIMIADELLRQLELI